MPKYLEIHNFPRVISPKVITRLKFELTYNDIAVLHVIHCTTEPLNLNTVIISYNIDLCIKRSPKFRRRERKVWIC